MKTVLLTLQSARTVVGPRTEEQVCGEQVHVGSLVLARIEELLTWQAMVPMLDNDPDTGYFSAQESGGRMGG